ncbi:hypothetical protein [Romboutsia sp.]|uniref:hypothetical protein n=1 Tax=Romboutsia sp. TaxID=1965302 RepID=UPI003F3E5A10
MNDKTFSQYVLETSKNYSIWSSYEYTSNGCLLIALLQKKQSLYKVIKPIRNIVTTTEDLMNSYLGNVVSFGGYINKSITKLTTEKVSEINTFVETSEILQNLEDYLKNIRLLSELKINEESDYDKIFGQANRFLQDIKNIRYNLDSLSIPTNTLNECITTYIEEVAGILNEMKCSIVYQIKYEIIDQHFEEQDEYLDVYYTTVVNGFNILSAIEDIEVYINRSLKEFYTEDIFTPRDPYRDLLEYKIIEGEEIEEDDIDIENDSKQYEVDEEQIEENNDPNDELLNNKIDERILNMIIRNNDYIRIISNLKENIDTSIFSKITKIDYEKLDEHNIVKVYVKEGIKAKELGVILINIEDYAKSIGYNVLVDFLRGK